MNKELYVSSTPHETRLALVEDGETAEVYIEREQEFSLAGAIYKGRVTRVLPGMQSAFVDIGLERDAFLYVSDFFEDSEEYDRVVSEAENAVQRLEARPAATETADGSPRAAEEAQAQAQAQAVERPLGAPVFSNLAEPAPGGEAQPESGGEEGRRHRRGRHRRGGARHGIPESKFARPGDIAATAPAAEAGGERAARPEPAPPAPAGAPYAPFILPGESLAKYRDRAPVPPPAPAAEPAAAFHPGAGPNACAPGEAEETTAPPEGGAEDDELAESSLASAYPEPLALRRDMLPERHVFEHERGQPDSPPHPSAAGVQAPASPAAAAEPAAEGREAAPASVDRQNDTEAAGPAPAGAGAEAGAEPSAQEPTTDHADAAPGGNAAQRNAPQQAHLQVRSHSRHRRRRHGRGGAPELAASVSAPAPEAEPEAAASARGGPVPSAAGPRLIGDLLRAGQEILIQVSKEPLGKKGARITSHLALPGRFLVYMPTVRHIGVSRKIGSDEERARLKRLILEHTRDLPGGFIVRTAGAGASEEEFTADIRLLSNLWNELRTQFEAARAPALLHHDLNLVERTLRDQLSGEFTHIWVDTDEQYQRVVKFIHYFMPQLVDRVRLYTREVPLFEHFGIQEEIDKALKSKVWLKSGGYIVLNQTEALVAIDVNTGKYVGKSNRLEDTIVKTNVDAIKEIVRQIRLRDLGGIIVIDFIDMDERRNRQRVMQALEEAMRADRAPSKVLSFNDFGLVALTRKRVKQSLERTLGSACPYCSGVGLVKSPTTVCNEIYTEVRKVAPGMERDDIVLRVNPEVARTLKAQGASRLQELEQLTGKSVSVRSDPQVHQEQFEIY